MTSLEQIASKIIKEQELIIGPIAWEEAMKVQGLEVEDRKSGALKITSADGRSTIDSLVSQYEHFFGRAAHEVCKDAAASILADLSPAEIPESLS